MIEAAERDLDRLVDAEDLRRVLGLVGVLLGSFTVRLNRDQGEVEPRRVRTAGQELGVPDAPPFACRHDDRAHQLEATPIVTPSLPWVWVAGGGELFPAGAVDPPLPGLIGQ